MQTVAVMYTQQLQAAVEETPLLPLRVARGLDAERLPRARHRRARRAAHRRRCTSSSWSCTRTRTTTPTRWTSSSSSRRSRVPGHVAGVEERVSRRTPLVGFLVADAISLCGTRVSMIAIPWLVLTTTGSAAQTGLVAFAELLPLVVVQALAGPLIDRLGARRVAITCDLLSMVVVGLIPLLHLARPAVVPGAARAGGRRRAALRGAGDGAKHAFVPALARGAEVPLERVTGLASAVERTASFAGAAMAGALVAFAGAGQRPDRRRGVLRRLRGRLRLVDREHARGASRRAAGRDDVRAASSARAGRSCARTRSSSRCPGWSRSPTCSTSRSRRCCCRCGSRRAATASA